MYLGPPLELTEIGKWDNVVPLLAEAEKTVYINNMSPDFKTDWVLHVLPEDKARTIFANDKDVFNNGLMPVVTSANEYEAVMEWRQVFEFEDAYYADMS